MISAPSETSGRATARGDLAGLDALTAEGVALFCFADVRPLAGVAGFVDWRCCGALSRTIVEGSFMAADGESLLLPVSGRFGPKRLFVFGLGPSQEAGRESLLMSARKAQKVMRRAGVRRPVFAAPASPHRPGLEREFAQAVRQELGSALGPILVEAEP